MVFTNGLHRAKSLDKVAKRSKFDDKDIFLLLGIGMSHEDYSAAFSALSCDGIEDVRLGKKVRP